MGVTGDALPEPGFGTVSGSGSGGGTGTGTGTSGGPMPDWYQHWQSEAGTLTGRSSSPQLILGTEVSVRLATDSVAVPHGTLTVGLVRFLEQADPDAVTAGDLAALAGPGPLHEVTVLTAGDPQARLLGSTALDDVNGWLRRLEQQDLRRLAERLEAVIAERESQDDLWPEGRLNAGIALAALGEVVAARRHLADAVDVFSGRGLANAEADMAMAL
jgi:hypothetical protein